MAAIYEPLHALKKKESEMYSDVVVYCGTGENRHAFFLNRILVCTQSLYLKTACLVAVSKEVSPIPPL